MKRVTLDDIAAMAGVSPSTVSRVLNGRKTVGERTRRRVLECVREMNYHPSPMIAGLAREVPTVLTVFAAYTKELQENRYFIGLLSGIKEVFDEPAWRSQWALAVEDGKVDSFTKDLILGGNLAGAILTTRACRPENLRLIEEAGLPCVFINRVSADHSCVFVDDKQAGYEMTSHLITHGHRAVAFLGDASFSSAVEGRLAGFRKAMQEAYGVDGPVISCPLDEAGGDAGIQRLLDEWRETTAVFAACDAVAMGAMKGAKERGLVLPRDLSFVGFDDERSSAYLDPPLTTVSVPLQDLGRMAARTLQDLICGASVRKVHVCLQHRPVYRASVAAAPKGSRTAVRGERGVMR